MEQPQQGGFPPSGKGGCVSCLHRERVPFAASEDPGVCQGQWAASHWRKDRAWGYRVRVPEPCGGDSTTVHRAWEWEGVGRSMPVPQATLSLFLEPLWIPTLLVRRPVLLQQRSCWLLSLRTALRGDLTSLRAGNGQGLRDRTVFTGSTWTRLTNCSEVAEVLTRTP